MVSVSVFETEIELVSMEETETEMVRVCGSTVKVYVGRRDEEVSEPFAERDHNVTVKFWLAVAL